jgi:S1-C subfamily serine protease
LLHKIRKEDQQHQRKMNRLPFYSFRRSTSTPSGGGGGGELLFLLLVFMFHLCFTSKSSCCMAFVMVPRIQQQHNHHYHQNSVVTAARRSSSSMSMSTAASLLSSSSSSSSSMGFVNVADQVHPYVVLVNPKGVRNITTRGSGFIVDMVPYFQKWEDTTTTTTPTTTTTAASVDRDASTTLYIVTAAHVAAPGWDIEVSLNTSPTTTTVSSVSSSPASRNRGRRHSATVIGRNRTLDLALLQVTLPPPLPTTTITDDDEEEEDTTTKKTTTTTMAPLLFQGARGLELVTHDFPSVGTLALAHGHPASRMRGPTMTMGIVCGIADGLGMPQNNDNDDTLTAESFNQTQAVGNGDEKDLFSGDVAFVVTDAAMSGGMSGGPLTDSQGRVLGINALIRPDLRALGNYAVSAMELHSFLQQVAADRNEAETSDKKNDDVKNQDAMSLLYSYQVVLFNDRFNKRERVSTVLQTIANLTETEANRVMMEAHSTGRGSIPGLYYSTLQEAESCLCRPLRQQDLLVEVERTTITKATTTNATMTTTPSH